jgi:hypothetical protein
MIKFFRHIRQRMITDNKTSKYLLYALGEIILVVIGILIALQINNWNEQRKQNVERQHLISSILEDFEYNRETLLNNRLPTIERALDKMELFFQLMQQDTELMSQGQLLPSAEVSVDSLRKLAIPFFQSYSFNANLTSLNEASSSGKLSLLKNKELFKEFTQFEMHHNGYQNLSREATHAYYNGYLWEIRKTVAPDVLAGINALPGLSYAEYKKIMDQPLAKTALYNSQVIESNKRRTLSDLLENTDKIISILKEMQQQ